MWRFILGAWGRSIGIGNYLIVTGVRHRLEAHIIGVDGESVLMTANGDADPILNDFRMVWLQLSGLDRKLQFQQAMATIYGAVQLFPIVPNPVAKDCYYFKNSVVHRRPNIDAFIISDGESLLLATNPFSPRFHALPSTRLYGVFAERKALVNPVALEQAGAIYVADYSVPRRDTQAVLEYVQRKYGIDRFLDLELVCTTASAAVKPRPSV